MTAQDRLEEQNLDMELKSIEALYHKESTEEPGSELDAAILGYAHKQAEVASAKVIPFQRKWFIPATAVASLAIVFTVALHVDPRDVQVQSVNESDMLAAPAPEPAIEPASDIAPPAPEKEFKAKGVADEARRSLPVMKKARPAEGFGDKSDTTLRLQHEIGEPSALAGAAAPPAEERAVIESTTDSAAETPQKHLGRADSDKEAVQSRRILNTMTLENETIKEDVLLEMINTALASGNIKKAETLLQEFVRKFPESDIKTLDDVKRYYDLQPRKND